MKTRSLLTSFVAVFGIMSFFFLITPHAEAAANDRYWVLGTGNWDDTAHWSLTSGGAGGAAVPLAGDQAHFDGFSGGGAVTMNAVASVNALHLSSAYTGSIVQTTNRIAVGTGHVLVGSGRIIGGTAVLSLSGSYTQTGGVVSLQNTFALSGSLSVTNAGSVSPSTSFTSTGTVLFEGKTDQNLIKGNNATLALANLTINNIGGTTIDDVIVNMSGGLVLSSGLRITLGNLDLDTRNMSLRTGSGIAIASAAQATFVTDANVTSSGSVTMAGALGTMTLSGTMTLTLDGVDQILDTNDAGIPNLVVSSSSGTSLVQNEVVSSTLTVSAGTTLTLSGYTLSATSATITNFGLITLNGGVLYHTPSAFTFADSSYTAKSSFTSGDIAYISLSEGDKNLNGTTVETVSVTITTAGGDSETLTLTETSVSSGIFRGSMSTGETNSAVHTGNNVIEVLNDTSTTMTASFTDSSDGVTSTASATLTGAAAESVAGQSGGGGGGGGGGSRRSGVIRSQSLPTLNERRYTTGEVVTQEGVQEGNASPWSDLSMNHPFADAAITLYEAGIVKGNDDGTVRLDRSLSRVEALTLLVRTLNAEPRSANITRFTDVDAQAWYAQDLQTAIAKKIVQGFPNNTFRPADSLNLVQSLKLICIGLGLASQDDEARAFQWYDPYVTVGREARLVSGAIDPARTVSRGEFFGWLVKVLGQ